MSEIIDISAPVDQLILEQDPLMREQLPVDEAAEVREKFNDIVDAIDLNVDKDLREKLDSVPVMKDQGAGDIIRRGSSTPTPTPPNPAPKLSRE
jgi:hypothetical protein